MNARRSAAGLAATQAAAAPALEDDRTAPGALGAMVVRGGASESDGEAKDEPERHGSGGGGGGGGSGGGGGGSGGGGGGSGGGGGGSAHGDGAVGDVASDEPAEEDVVPGGFSLHAWLVQTGLAEYEVGRARRRAAGCHRARALSASAAGRAARRGLR